MESRAPLSHRCGRGRRTTSEPPVGKGTRTVVLLGAWLATPLVGVGAAATLVATVGLAVAMLMPHRPRRHGARPVRPAAR
ncbi:MAG: hypothetical protein EOP28_03310 [Rhodococcus sp. (in: high G+C Gram-positive bacteria)]|nr:MAG: hypothetical protein EOP28_03310 [Rhodococcus sp. (in: high G+C Gram-positive bacteria)]